MHKALSGLELLWVEGLGGPNIFGARDRSQMIRIDAALQATDVIDFFACGDRPLEVDIGNDVRFVVPGTDPKLSVAWASSRRPNPTAARRLENNLRHEAIVCGLIGQHWTSALSSHA